jgi:hypothetical protein
MMMFRNNNNISSVLVLLFIIIATSLNNVVVQRSVLLVGASDPTVGARPLAEIASYLKDSNETDVSDIEVMDQSAPFLEESPSIDDLNGLEPESSSSSLPSSTASTTTKNDDDDDWINVSFSHYNHVNRLLKDR